MDTRCPEVIMNDYSNKIQVTHMLKLPIKFSDIMHKSNSEIVLCGNAKSIDLGTGDIGSVTCKICFELLNNNKVGTL